MTGTETIAYGIKDACEVSGLGKTKLYSLINTGEITAVHAGRKTLILRASIEAYFQRLTETAKVKGRS